ncbi:MAG: sel1 repeat family protein [Planctomycetes bacterium]|nr:sel1 repeat family protein [Planctomycetota bacterium]
MRKSIAFPFAAVALAALFLSAMPIVAEDTVEAPQTQAEAQAQQQQQTISPVEAFTLMAGEAEKGNTAAMLTLGTMYERGIGTPRNFVKAREWYQKAAAAGLAEGYYNVGVCYEIGMGTTGDPAIAFTNFEKSAELGLSQGLYKLASLYFAGIGTGKNEPWGVELLGGAAAAGHAGAANDLGVISFEGTYGQPKDLTKAFDWFTRSAEMGNGEAMKNLAVFYRDGLGRPADPEQELKWYALARLAGYPAAPLNSAIERVRGLLTEEQIAKVEADAQTWVKTFQERQQAAAGGPGSTAPAQ